MNTLCALRASAVKNKELAMKALILGAVGEMCTPATKDIIRRNIFPKATLADINVEKVRVATSPLYESINNIFFVTYYYHGNRFAMHANCPRRLHLGCWPALLIVLGWLPVTSYAQSSAAPMNFEMDNFDIPAASDTLQVLVKEVHN